jgi:Pectate lyase superfamily protein
MSLSFLAEPYGLSVRDFGARGDGITDDAPAIQKALDGPRRVITIPEGIYLVGETLRIGSERTLIAHPLAVIRLADGAARNAGDFLLANADYHAGNHHITVSGGIWDGNNENNRRGPDGSRESCTGVAINFVNVQHLRLTDLTVRNPDSFSIRLGEAAHFTVENITFDHPVLRPNQDGVHVGGFSEDGVIRNLRAIAHHSTNDDMVALNADDDVERALNLGMKRGPIRNIHVENISAESAYTFVRLLSETQPLTDIRIRGISGGCRYYAVNLNRWRFPEGSGNIRNVHIQDVRVGKTTDAKDLPLIPINLGVQDLVIERLQRPQEDRHEAPTLVIGNRMHNVVEFTTTKREQLERLNADSTGVEGVVRPLTLPDGVALHQATFQMAPAGHLVLASGDIERLALNSWHEEEPSSPPGG